MARLLNAPFYENYCYDDRGFECRFIQDGSTSLWAVEIRRFCTEPPVHTTARFPSRFSAYAQARAWCASRGTQE